jgi:hypothetical protein
MTASRNKKNKKNNVLEEEEVEYEPIFYINYERLEIMGSRSHR